MRGSSVYEMTVESGGDRDTDAMILRFTLINTHVQSFSYAKTGCILVVYPNLSWKMSK